MPPRMGGSHARSSFLATLTAAAALALACRRGGGPPYTPADSLKTVRLEAGLRIEPFVSEPAIASPVAMEFDERGRIFVVEMPGYPLDTRPTGRVKLLEDRDHDGRYETVTVFADNLVLPTGVMRWKRGILVTAAPDVWYFEDTDGDGRADVRKVVLTGFAFTNPQHTVNGPLYGLADRFSAPLGANPLRDIVRGYGVALGTFPSLHAGIALVVLVFAWRDNRRLFWLLLPIALGIWASTLYLRYHYVVDLLAGWVLALGCCWLAPRLNQARRRWLSSGRARQTRVRLARRAVGLLPGRSGA